MAEQTHSETQVSESLPLTNELLMDEVRTYTALYDRYNKDFKDKFKKLNAWTEIGKRFGISPSQAEKKYNNIRSSFVRYLRQKKKIPTGSGRKDLPPPPEFTNLDWLVTFIEHKYTSSNFQRSLTSKNEEDIEQGDKGEINKDMDKPSESPSPWGHSTDDASLLDDSIEVHKEQVINDEPTRSEVKRPWAKGNKRGPSYDVDRAISNQSSVYRGGLRYSTERAFQIPSHVSRIIFVTVDRPIRKLND